MLRAGRLDELDLANLAEELETLGRSQWNELENRLEVLLMHMQKRDHQPEKRTRSWDATISEQRTRLRRLFRRSPSLRRNLEFTVAEVYRDARRQAAIETGRTRPFFRKSCPTASPRSSRPRASSRRGRRDAPVGHETGRAGQSGRRRKASLARRTGSPNRPCGRQMRTAASSPNTATSL